MITVTTKILIFIFLFSSMFSIGLQVDFHDITSLLKKRGLLFKSLATNFIIIPVIGLILTKLISLPPAVSLAFIVLALTPGGLSAIQFVSKIKGESTFAGLLVCLLSILAVFISPLLISLFLPANIKLKIPYFGITLIFVFFLLLPLIAGFFLQYKKPIFANKIAKLFSIIGTLAFVTMIITTLKLRNIAITAHTGQVIITMLLFIFLAMLTGWLMGGPEKKDREVLAIITSMRNIALCLAIAMETIPEAANVITPIVALGALMVFPNMLFTLVMIFLNKKYYMI